MGEGQKPAPSHSVFSSTWTQMELSAAPVLPPGEEGFSALETLRVGLSVGSLGRPSRLNNNWWHLDQLEGRFTVLQGLGQVQDLNTEKI